MGLRGLHRYSFIIWNQAPSRRRFRAAAFCIGSEVCGAGAQTKLCASSGSRGGLVLKAHRLLYHSTLGLRVIKRKRERGAGAARAAPSIDLLFSSLLTSNLSKRDQLLTTHRSPSTGNRDPSTEDPSWGYSKVNFDRFFRKRGRFSPNVDKNEEMAPRTRTGYPHEGPFVVPGIDRSRVVCCAEYQLWRAVFTNNLRILVYLVIYDSG